MTVTMNPPVRTSFRTLLFTFSSDLGGTPDLYIYEFGVLMRVTKETSYETTVLPGRSKVVEILDSASEVPMRVARGTFLLGWDAVSSAKEYRVEEKVSSVWTLRGTVPEDGRGFYRFETGWLADVVVHEFRVIAVGSNGDLGTAREYTALMVRNPDPRDYTSVYAAGTGLATVTDVTNV